MLDSPLQTLKVLSVFLRYPEAVWIMEVDVLLNIARAEAVLPLAMIDDLQILGRRLKTADLVDAQEHYVGLFDRSRALSLHLFEHVHGESRDRGQAMVDLAEIYREHGLDPVAQELPDYLPLFLEFLTTLPRPEALGMLQDPVNIFTALAGHLTARGSDYAVIARSLEHLAGRSVDMNTAAIPIVSPPDIDALWEEPSVQFLDSPAPKAGCGSACSGSCG